MARLPTGIAGNLSWTLIYIFSTTEMAKILADIALNLLSRWKHTIITNEESKFIFGIMGTGPFAIGGMERRYTRKRKEYAKFNTLRSSELYSLLHDNILCPESPHLKQISKL